jgi:hypothetical protein
VQHHFGGVRAAPCDAALDAHHAEVRTAKRGTCAHSQRAVRCQAVNQARAVCAVHVHVNVSCRLLCACMRDEHEEGGEGRTVADGRQTAGDGGAKGLPHACGLCGLLVLLHELLKALQYWRYAGEAHNDRARSLVARWPEQKRLVCGLADGR